MIPDRSASVPSPKGALADWLNPSRTGCCKKGETLKFGLVGNVSIVILRVVSEPGRQEPMEQSRICHLFPKVVKIDVWPSRRSPVIAGAPLRKLVPIDKLFPW